MRGRRHLSTDRLVELCFDGALLPAEQHHLDSCAACTERRGQLTSALDDAAAAAAAEADAAFDAPRLARQRTRILQRLEQEGRLGRVIAFPAARGDRPPLRARPGARWIAGAAAAGLLIGILADHVVHVLPSRAQMPPAPAAFVEAPETLQAASSPLSEEELLGLLDLALEGTAGVSLRPLDDLTPRVWEVAAQSAPLDFP